MLYSKLYENYFKNLNFMYLLYAIWKKVIYNEMVVDLEGCKVIGPAVKFSQSVNLPRSPPPKLGQHTRSILRNILNYTDDKIDKLIKQKIIG